MPGSLASLDTTLPPTPLKKLLEADGASVYVFSSDRALIDAVQEAGGAQYPIHVVPDWTGLLALVEGGQCKIVLLDADHLHGGFEKRIGELNGLASSLVILVAAPRDAAQTLIGLLSGRSIHRLLIKPAAVGITRLLLESAVSRYLQLRELAPHELEEIFSGPRGRDTSGRTLATRWPAWVLALALVSLLVGGVLVGSFLRLGPSESGSPGADGAAASSSSAAPLPTLEVTSEPIVAAPGTLPAGADASPIVDSAADDGTGPEAAAPAAADPAAAPVEPPSPEADPHAELIAQGELAFQEGRLAAPVGDSALDYYAAVLAQAPDHPRVNQLLADAIDIVFGQAEAALLEGMLDDASGALEHVRRVRPTSTRLAFLDAQLARARVDAEAAAAPVEAVAREPASSPSPAGAADPSRPAVGQGDGAGGEPVVDAAPAEPRPSAAPAIPPSELESLLTIGRSRLAQGRVLTADGDGARAYLDRAAALAPDADGVVSLRAGVAAAMVGEARLALAAGDLGRAERLFADASELGAEPETLALLNLDLEAAREARADAEARALLEDAVAAIGAGRLIEPTGDNALESLTALRSQAADTPGLAAAWADLLGALTRNAERAIGAQDWDAAERWIGAIRSAEAGAPGLAELEGELQAAQLQAAYLANPASVGELVLRTQGTVLYPEDAQRREIEGWVDLAYVVGTDGVPKDIRVLEANPAEWFEDAAVESVSQYRYVPFELDGRRYERLAHMRIRFNLQ